MKKTAIVAASVALAWCSRVAFAAPPAWCKGQDFQQAVFGEVMGHVDTRGELPDQVRSIIEWTCSSGGSGAKVLDDARPQLEQVRAALSKRLLMTDADWADAVVWTKDSYVEPKLTGTTLASLGPIDQYVAISRGFKNGNYDLADDMYIADALESQLTETGRLAFLEGCTAWNGVGWDDELVARWAICQGDVTRLDITKLLTELRSDTTEPATTRIWLHIHAFVVLDGLKKAAEQAQALFKRDDAYKKVFDVAAKARDEWTKTLGTNKELLELVQAMDSATFFHSRKQHEGCEDKTRSSLVAAVSTIPAKTFAGMHDVRDNPYKGFADAAGPMIVNVPIVNLAASAFVQCQPDRPTSKYLGFYLHDLPGMRGPRSAAFTALLGQKFELDDTSRKEVRLPKMGARPFPGEQPASGGGVAKSIVAGTGDDKGKMVVAIQPIVIREEECVKEHQTNRVVSISSGGDLRYELVCDKYEMVNRDDTWNDFKMSPDTAKWLKPGARFSALFGGRDASEVIAVWPSKTAKLPSLLLGAPLK